MGRRGPRASSAANHRGRAVLRNLVRETGEFGPRTNRMLGPASARVVGVFYRGREGGKVVPADRRNRDEYRVAERDAEGAEDGELVRVEQLSTGNRGFRRARIVEQLGLCSDPGAVSLFAIAS